MDASDSTAQVLARGSQVFAALAGLFCTDGVERNLSAAQFGYATVAASSLSILGLLGLVKNIVKTALGLQRCITAGSSLVSMRGHFGPLVIREPPNGSCQCDIVDVYQYRNRYQDSIYLRKRKRYLEKERTPLVDVGSDWSGGLNGVTVVNLGNAQHEASFYQSHILIGLTAFLCSGATSWLLLIIETSWSWLSFVSMPGLHGSLLVILAVPLFYEMQTSRPATHISSSKFHALFKGFGQPSGRMHFLQSRINGGDVLHFRGNTAILEIGLIRLVYLLISALRYSIRLSSNQSEYSLIRNSAAAHLTFAELLCSATTDCEFPRWVWEYLQSADLIKILLLALQRDKHVTPFHEDVFCFPLVDFDLARIIVNRATESERRDLQDILERLTLRLALKKDHRGNVEPFIMIEALYKLVPSEFSRTQGYGFVPCRAFAVNDQCERIHLRDHLTCLGHRNTSPSPAPMSTYARNRPTCPWPTPSNSHIDIANMNSVQERFDLVARLCTYLSNRQSTSRLLISPDVYLTATPGTVTRRGVYCDSAHRHAGILNEYGFNFEDGVREISEYIKQVIPKKPYSWASTVAAMKKLGKPCLPPTPSYYSASERLPSHKATSDSTLRWSTLFSN
ncbi:hypothetical protein M501DRAFT_1017973 [Patellaria atrata CBS 101060]|uniref:Uncharacterized protein n=1 Tax=Patellaria atrata CBS 101060 TaxID=1346257 RepID=A0A9P4VQA3_9PEZI|nr:hypothetical protein M501DRAFT_1017973 [Patellaria atrata CBS 101060]